LPPILYKEFSFKHFLYKGLTAQNQKNYILQYICLLIATYIKEIAYKKVINQKMELIRMDMKQEQQQLIEVECFFCGRMHLTPYKPFMLDKGICEYCKLKSI